MIEFVKTKDTQLNPHKRYYVFSVNRFILVTTPVTQGLTSYYERKSSGPIMAVAVKNEENTMYNATFVDLTVCPSGYRWTLEDVSDSDAGRTEDLMMQKKRVGQCLKLELSWQNLSIEDAATVLKLFDPEYLFVEYLDAKSGAYECRQFYVGNRAAPLYNSKLGIWSEISFNLVERGVTDD